MGKPIDSKKPLTDDEKRRILEIIFKQMQPDDRLPIEVIETSYQGDANAYFEDMRGVLNIEPDPMVANGSDPASSPTDAGANVPSVYGFPMYPEPEDRDNDK